MTLVPNVFPLGVPISMIAHCKTKAAEKVIDICVSQFVEYAETKLIYITKKQAEKHIKEANIKVFQLTAFTAKIDLDALLKSYHHEAKNLDK